MTELVALRKRLNAQLAALGETREAHRSCPFFCKALVAALRQFPELNATMDEAAQELILRGAFNFGIAASTDDGPHRAGGEERRPALDPRARERDRAGSARRPARRS